MLEKGKISYKHLISIIFMIVSPTAILYLPSMTYREAKQDSFIPIIMITIVTLFFAQVVISLGHMYQNKTIIQYSQDILGKALGKITGLIFCLFLVHVNSVIIREFAELLAGPFMKLTPLWFFVIGIILPSIYAVIKGLEVIDRVNQIIFPIYIIFLSAIVLLSYKDMDFRNTMPVFTQDITSIMNGFYRTFIWFGEVALLSMIMPYVNMPKKVKKMTFISIIYLVLLGAIVNIAIITTFGKNTQNLSYPFLSLARYISVANFFERLDSIIMFMWISGVFIKITIFHYCATLAIAQWLELKDYRITAVVTGIVMAVLSITLWSNLTQLKNQLITLTLPYTIIQMGIPVVLFIVAKIKKGLGYG